MKQNKTKPKEKGVQVSVSPKAHAKMRDEGYKAKPKRNLREQINHLNGLPTNV